MHGEDITSVVISSPLGNLQITTDHQHLLNLNFLFDAKKNASKNLSGLQKIIISQLENYFADANFQFALPLRFNGTEFQRRVWKTLTKIPSSNTWTYGEMAKKLNTHARAIGQACRHNPIAIIVPCHRVVSATNLGGYSGAIDGKFMQIKQWLLHHENQSFLA